jgi:DNA polymerase-3 subunit epsilon
MTAPALDLETMAATLEASESYRVLRRLTPRKKFNDEPWNLGDKSQVKVALVLDVESTGLDTSHDEIIELAAFAVSYDAVSGTVYEIRSGYHGYEQPTIPISAEARAKHHITDEMVAGERLDDERIMQLLATAGLVVAYNASFDRQMVERRVPAFRDVPWACACFGVDWDAFGVVGRKLENVLLHACGVFFDAHNAADDVAATVHALATAQKDGRPAMAYLLESARTPTTRVWARGAPFDLKDDLKLRGYRWQPARKTWYKDVAAERGTQPVSAELTFLECHGVRAEITTLSAKDRFSVRADA